MSPRQQKTRRRPAARRPGAGRDLGNARLPLIVFGALLALLFAGVAVAQGLGRPDAGGDEVVVVEEAPGDGVGTITQEEFDRALDQAAARANRQEVPEEGTNAYDEIAQAALNDLLDTVWIQGEAEEQGISATQSDIEDQLEQIKTENFQSEKEFQRFLEESGFNAEDVNLRVELQLLSEDLQGAVQEGGAPVTAEQIEDYYEAAKSQFELPETRDVRLVLNRDEAKVEDAKAQLEEDSSPQAWDRIAREFSTDPASQANGGRRPGLTEGLVEEPLNREIFAAEEGEIVGPVKTPLGSYVFQVEKVTPGRTQSLDEVRRQIRTQLQQQADQEGFAAFIEEYGSKWQSRTICSEDLFEIGDGPGGAGALERCDNFTGSGHPAEAPPGCYEENPRGGRPPACPAPVVLLAPALPGSVTALAPQGQRLQQRPRPAGLRAAAPPELPGATPLPPGVAP